MLGRRNCTGRYGAPMKGRKIQESWLPRNKFTDNQANSTRHATLWSPPAWLTSSRQQDHYRRVPVDLIHRFFPLCTRYAMSGPAARDRREPLPPGTMAFTYLRNVSLNTPPQPYP